MGKLNFIKMMDAIIDGDVCRYLLTLLQHSNVELEALESCLENSIKYADKHLTRKQKRNLLNSITIINQILLSRMLTKNSKNVKMYT